jgi:hypothetical protein
LQYQRETRFSEAARAKILMRELNGRDCPRRRFSIRLRSRHRQIVPAVLADLSAPPLERGHSDWLEICGIQIEGAVTAISNVRITWVELVTLELAVQHGTASASAAILQQVPQDWLSLEAADVFHAWVIMCVLPMHLERSWESRSLFVWIAYQRSSGASTSRGSCRRCNQRGGGRFRWLTT